MSYADRQVELIAELAGETCRCGKSKQARHTFCRSCFLSLTPKQRAALYQRMGEGYEEAYAAAVKQLERRDGS